MAAREALSKLSGVFIGACHRFLSTLATTLGPGGRCIQAQHNKDSAVSVNK